MTNRRPYNLYCVGADVKPCSIHHSSLTPDKEQSNMLAFNGIV